MRLAMRLLLVASASAVSPAPVVTALEDPSPSPGTTAPQPIIWLRGPFGTVPSGDDAPLDVYVRSAPLRLETGDPDVSIGEWRASFQVVGGGAAPTEMHGSADGGVEAGGATITGPDEPGAYRLETEATLSDGSDATAAWTVVVPDRPLPPDGLIEVPAPELLLTGGSGTVAGWAGSGCYIYLCVEVGRLPPLRTVTQMDVTAGEDLRLRLSDASGIAAWKVTLYPIVSGLQPAMDEIGDEPDAPLEYFDVEAPVPGEWLMLAEVTFDRLRGWRHAFYRLTSRPQGPAARAPIATAVP
jgi:hypothetical protein